MTKDDKQAIKEARSTVSSTLKYLRYSHDFADTEEATSPINFLTAKIAGALDEFSRMTSRRRK